MWRSLCQWQLRFYTTRATRLQPWQPWEDKLLANFVKHNGNRWAELTQHVLPHRSALQCQMRWRDIVDPAIKQGPFSSQESELLHKGVQQFGEGNWKDIANALLPHRSPRRLATEWWLRLKPTFQPRAAWTSEEDEILKKAVQEHGRCWSHISRTCLPHRSPISVRQRYLLYLDPTTKKGAWDDDELDVLFRRTIMYGPGDWKKVAEGLPGRTPEMCAAKWTRALDPALNQKPWTEEETLLFWQQIRACGGKLSRVAKALPGRSRIMCAAKFNDSLPELFALYGNAVQLGHDENRDEWRARLADLMCNWIDNKTTIKTDPSGALVLQETRPWTTEESEDLVRAVQHASLTSADWRRIAKQHSRSVEQCQHQYERLSGKGQLGYWTPEEDAKLRALYAEHGPQWTRICASIAHRTPSQCEYRWQKVLRHNHVQKSRLSDQEKELIREGVAMFHHNWQAISNTYLPHRTPEQCMRWWLSQQQGKIRGTWSEEEDNTLKFAVSIYGQSWADVARLIEGRSAQQCRSRWINSLNPDFTRGKWSDDEESQLIEVVEKHRHNKTPKLWPAVAKDLGTGRTATQCYNKYKAMQRTGGRLGLRH